MTLTLAPETEARLLAAAAEKGVAPEEVIDVLLKQYDDDEHDNDAAHAAMNAEQDRLQGIFDRLYVDALALEVEPVTASSVAVNQDRAPEEAQVTALILEKYRKKGYHL